MDLDAEYSPDVEIKNIKTSRFTNPAWRAIQRCPLLYARGRQVLAKLALEPVSDFNAYFSDWQRQLQEDLRAKLVRLSPVGNYVFCS